MKNMHKYNIGDYVFFNGFEYLVCGILVYTQSKDKDSVCFLYNLCDKLKDSLSPDMCYVEESQITQITNEEIHAKKICALSAPGGN